MPNPYGVPEIEVADVAKLRQDGSNVLLVDVREPEELEIAKISGDDVVLMPLSRLAAEGEAAIPEALKDQTGNTIVFCHHGLRSAQVVAWLQRQGWENVRSMNGGINRYASEIDETIGFY